MNAAAVAVLARIEARHHEQAEDLAVLRSLLAGEPAAGAASPVPTGERWLSSKEAAKIAGGTARSTLIRWAGLYGIGFQRANDEWVFLESKLRAFLDGTTKKPVDSATSATDETDERRPEPQAGLTSSTS
jgi:hypothetical protein